MNEQPSYYANIPAPVRYDKKLPSKAPLLYGEITALSNKEGYCWASDKYFMDLYEASKPTIQRWLNALETQGYIERRVTYKENSQEIDKRYIVIADTLYSKTITPYTQKRDYPIIKNETVNTTSINTTSNNIKDIGKAEPTDTFGKECNEVISYLNQKTGANFKSAAKANQKVIKARFKEGYKLEDFKKVIDTKVSTWLNNSEMSKYLRPVTLFGNKFDSYLNEVVKNKIDKSVKSERWDNFF